MLQGARTVDRQGEVNRDAEVGNLVVADSDDMLLVTATDDKGFNYLSLALGTTDRISDEMLERLNLGIYVTQERAEEILAAA